MREGRGKPLHLKKRAALLQQVRTIFDVYKSTPITDGLLPLWCAMFRSHQLLYIAALLKNRDPQND
jgi:hypothetical protein